MSHDMTSRNVIIPVDLKPEELIPPPAHWPKISLVGQTMGTNWSCLCYGATNNIAPEIEQELKALFNDMIAQMSNWDPTSWVSRFNNAEIGENFPLPDDVETVLRSAVDIACLTKGAFNPCLGADVDKLIFNSDVSAEIIPKIQPRDEIWRQFIQMDFSKGINQTGEIIFDLSAIAKGYAVDQMAVVLRGFGITSFLVEIGGEFLGQGVKADGQPWWVTIDEAQGEAENMIAAMSGLAVATSGNIHRYYQTEQGLSPHIIPRVEGFRRNKNLLSVSVFDSSCMFADGWATGLFSLGVKQGGDGHEQEDALALAGRLNIAAYFQFSDQSFQASDALIAML